MDCFLGVDSNANEDMIRKAYHKKMKEAHPDTEKGNNELAIKINEAYKTALDAKKA